MSAIDYAFIGFLWIAYCGIEWFARRSRRALAECITDEQARRKVDLDRSEQQLAVLVEVVALIRSNRAVPEDLWVRVHGIDPS